MEKKCATETSSKKKQDEDQQHGAKSYNEGTEFSIERNNIKLGNCNRDNVFFMQTNNCEWRSHGCCCHRFRCVTVVSVI